jgi:hypothetical protein
MEDLFNNLIKEVKNIKYIKTNENDIECYINNLKICHIHKISNKDYGIYFNIFNFPHNTKHYQNFNKCIKFIEKLVDNHIFL